MLMKIRSFTYQCQRLGLVSAFMVMVAPAVVAAPCPAFTDYAAGVLSCDLPQDCTVAALPALGGNVAVFDNAADGKALFYLGRKGAETLFVTVTCAVSDGAAFTDGGLLSVDTTDSYSLSDSASAVGGNGGQDVGGGCPGGRPPPCTTGGGGGGGSGGFGPPSDV